MASGVIANLLSRHYSISSAINLIFSYNNGDINIGTFRIGDEVSIAGYMNSKNITKITGLLTDVIVRKDLCSNSFRHNEKTCDANFDVIFKIDTSITSEVNILDVRLSNITDMILGDNTDVLHLDGVESKKYNVKSNVKLKFTYDNKETNVVDLQLGDEITIERFADSTKTKLDRESGIIFDIVNKKESMTTSFSSNQKSGNGGYDLLFRLNKSYKKTINDIKDFYLIDFQSIIMGDADYDDPYPPIPYREPEPISEDPVDPSIKCTINTITNLGNIDCPEIIVDKNDNATIKIFYGDHKKRMVALKINDIEYTYDKTTGIYTPELPSNIGIVEELPNLISMMVVFGELDDHSQYELDIDFVDEESQKLLDFSTSLYIDGQLSISVLTVEQDYNIEVIFGDNEY